MIRWFERRGQTYLRVAWVDAGAFDGSRQYIEVPAWEVLDGAPPDVRVFRQRHPHEIPPEDEAESRGAEGGSTAGDGPSTEGESEPEAPVEEEPRAWIEVQLIDANGAPISGESCRITLTNGKVVEQATDKYGLVRVDGIDPGKCEVAFPKLKDGVWEPA